MKILLYGLIIVFFSACVSKVPASEETQAKTLSFNSLWYQVASSPLEKLPRGKIGYGKLSSNGEDIIMKNSVRTLHDHRDIIAPFEKLAHPNGICFKGTWKIDTPNIYSGYFKEGSEALIIARASTAMSQTKKGKIRAFGFAGKLFPTLDKDKAITQNRANFFLIDDLGGTNEEYYTKVEMTNEPDVSFTREVMKHLAYSIKVARTFSHADSNAGIRQLYEISELGVEQSKQIITPKWMMLEAKSMPTREQNDFRDALKIQENKDLVFKIYVANSKTEKKQDWQYIGTITLDTSIVSQACDKQLHFHHPKWRDDLDYGVP